MQRTGSRSTPSVCDPRLGRTLKTLRGKTGLSGGQAAAHMGWSESKISRAEHGRAPITITDLERLLDLYQAKPQQRTQILEYAHETGRRNRGLPGIEHASVLREWAPAIIPAILQDPGYTRTILASTQQVTLVPPSEIETALEAVREQQTRLTSGIPPLSLQAVIGEAALGNGFGSREIMRGQLNLLITLAALPDTDIRIMRAGLNGGGPRGISAYSCLSFPPVQGAQLPDLVLIHGLKTVRLEEEDDTWRHRIAFERLLEAADPDAASILKTHYAKWSPSVESRASEIRTHGRSQGAG